MKNQNEGFERDKSLEIVDSGKLPRHIAIIMDGNGRWALQRRLPRSLGHRAGMEALSEIVDTCCDLKIEVLTVYGFSTENWKRPQDEVSYIMSLTIEYLSKKLEEFCRKGVRVNPIGILKELPQQVQDILANSTEQSRDNKALIFNLAINYGGRIEITNAVRSIARAVEAGSLQAGQVDMQVISDYLYTAGQPDPDLLIRTGGEFRISNFLLWQLAYSEIWVTDLMWPDFGRQHLLNALLDYQKRERRFGGLQKKSRGVVT